MSHNTKKYRNVLFIIFACALFNNCDYDLHPHNCPVDNTRLKMPLNNFPEAIINKDYSYSICYIGMERDECFDGWTILDYDYDYQVDGDLPKGIFYKVSNKCITFYGTPNEKGLYEFMVRVYVYVRAGIRNSLDTGDEETKIECENYESRNYSILVN